MGRIFVLYNPIAGNQQGKDKAKQVAEFFADKEICYLDITSIENFSKFARELLSDDEIVVCGGDGTLNRFVNKIYNLDIKNNILYYATGSGNDFLRDMEKEVGCAPFSINKVIRNLPSVTVNGKSYRFLNGVGFGIDGYCCEVGDKLRQKSEKPVDYSSIAVKGLLFHYKPTNATVEVDGEKYSFKKVWIAPTMFGRFYGGGMMPAPQQSRNNKKNTVSLCVVHNSGKIKTLCVFPSLFKGKHTSHSSMVKILSGHNISVKFDRPVALQIDGETILNVLEYNVRV